MGNGLTTDNYNAIIAIFKLFPEIQEAILYGSRARGNYKSTSDIDITLKGKGLNLNTMSKIIFMIDDLPMPYKFDISIYHHITNSELLKHIEHAGQSLYQANSTKISYQD